MDNGHNLKLTAAELDVALEKAQNISNHNFLDNWYFGNPVDQRGGYVVPPGATAVSQIGGSTFFTVDKHYTVTKHNDDWYTFTANGTLWYVYKDNVVRGYAGAGYTIDRWRTYGNASIAIEADGIVFHAPDETSTVQLLEFSTKEDMVFTFSVLNKTGTLYACIRDAEWGDYGYAQVTGEGVATVTAVVPKGKIPMLQFFCGQGESVKVKAAKLELGTEQTLAHQDENGNWVLNEIPNYAEELAKCQRYFVNLNPGHGSYFTVGSGYVVSETVAEIVAPIPTTMRAFPVVVTNGFAISAGSALWAEDAIVYNCSSGSVNLHCTISGGTVGHPCFAYGGVENYVWLDANL